MRPFSFLARYSRTILLALLMLALLRLCNGATINPAPFNYAAPVLGNLTVSGNGPTLLSTTQAMTQSGTTAATGAVNIPFVGASNAHGNYLNVVADGQYNMTPYVIALGTPKVLYMVYRKASQHQGTIGSVIFRTSADLGRTWSAEVNIFTDGTFDSREPALSYINNVLYCTFYKENTSTSKGQGVWQMSSTNLGASWSVPTQIVAPNGISGTIRDIDLAATGPGIKLSNGNWIQPFYGSTGPDYSAGIAVSTDGNTTYPAANDVVIFAGVTGHDYVEPHVTLLANGSLFATVRDTDTNNITASTSTNNGATWSAPTVLFPGLSTMRTIQLHNGDLLGLYRSGYSADLAAIRVSHDNGVTWTTNANEFVIDDLAKICIYGCPVEVANGLVLLAYAVEQSASQCDIRLRYSGYGGGATPLGNGLFKGLATYDADMDAYNSGFSLRNDTDSVLNGRYGMIGTEVGLHAYNGSSVTLSADSSTSDHEQVYVASSGTQVEIGGNAPVTGDTLDVNGNMGVLSGGAVEFSAQLLKMFTQPPNTNTTVAIVPPSGQNQAFLDIDQDNSANNCSILELSGGWPGGPLPAVIRSTHAGSGTTTDLAFQIGGSSKLTVKASNGDLQYTNHLVSTEAAPALTAVTGTGWGAHATSSFGTGATGTSGTITVTTSALDSASANPTLVLTTANAWPTGGPRCLAQWDSSSTGPYQAVFTTTNSTTQVTITYNGTPTPTTSKTYVITYWLGN